MPDVLVGRFALCADLSQQNKTRIYVHDHLECTGAFLRRRTGRKRQKARGRTAIRAIGFRLQHGGALTRGLIRLVRHAPAPCVAPSCDSNLVSPSFSTS
jgi:hypothetical protein